MPSSLGNTGDSQEFFGDLKALAARLAERRNEILATWRRAAIGDPELTTPIALSRAQFYDHIPAVLDAFQRKLTAKPGIERLAAFEEQRELAASHGLLRWQQGYRLVEVMGEWAHLNFTLLDELERDAAAHPELPAGMMVLARRALAEVYSEGVAESVAQYVRFQLDEAAERARNLERALTKVSELDRQRAEAWREAAHDLRGNVSVFKNVTAVLGSPLAPESARTNSLRILQDNVESLHRLLNDLLEIARLEAGQEKRKIAPFDAGALLAELCANFQPLAEQRGLFLSTDGEMAPAVEGDAVKIRRIVQNLVLNALQQTERGGVKVTWAMADPDHWTFSVQDTGPGFAANANLPLAQALKEATDEAQVAQEQIEPSVPDAELTPPAPTLNSQSHTAAPTSHEGIGLSIVKSLCDLLDANLELQTEVGKGSTFRVTLPVRYLKG